MSRFQIALSDLVKIESLTPATSAVIDINSGRSKSRTARLIVVYASDQAIVSSYTRGNDAAGTDGGTTDVAVGSVTDTVRMQIFDLTAKADGRYVAITLPVAPAAMMVEYYNHDVSEGFLGYSDNADGTKTFTSRNKPGSAPTDTSGSGGGGGGTTDPPVSPPDENDIVRYLAADVGDWTLSGATLVDTAGEAVFASTGANSPAAATAQQAVTTVTTGDFIWYAKLKSDMIAGSGVQLTLRNGGQSKLIVSLGYNYVASAYQVGRVSMAVRRGGALVGVAGPTVDYAAAEVDIAVQYDSRVGCANLFIRESGRWVFYGSEIIDAPYPDLIEMGTQGDDAASATIVSNSFNRPNYVSIGDSICAGHNFYDPDPTFYAGTDNGENAWQLWAVPSARENNLIVNYGVGGETSLEIDNRVAGMLAATEPAVVILHASSNDFAGPTYAVRTANIQSSVNKVTASGADCILLNSVVPNASHASHPTNAAYYKGWWDGNSQDVTGVTHRLNIMDGISDASGDAHAAFFESDGVHPKVSGYQVIGATVKTALV